MDLPRPASTEALMRSFSSSLTVQHISLQAFFGAARFLAGDMVVAGAGRGQAGD